MRDRDPTLRLDIPSSSGASAPSARVDGAGRSRRRPVGPPHRPRPSRHVEIVVTTSVLGSVVRDLVGDRATVTVLMANGVDPHDWSPSAQDIESVYRADLVVEQRPGPGGGPPRRARGGGGERRARVPGRRTSCRRASVERTRRDHGDDGPPRHPATSGWIRSRCATVVDALTPVLGRGSAWTSPTAPPTWTRRLDALDAEVQADARDRSRRSAGSWSPATSRWASSPIATASSWWAP